MRKSFLVILILLSVAIFTSYFLGSCKKNEGMAALQMLQQEIPAGFPQPAYTFADNILSKEGVELGRKLFYDARLSIDNTISCSSCHQQAGSFGTFEHDLSHGVNNSHTLRNAPVLFNLAWSNSFHWDGEFTSLKDEASQPITGTIEMGESFQGIISKIKSDAGYRSQFKVVFSNPDIKQEYILKALAQFTGSLISADSGRFNTLSQCINHYRNGVQQSGSLDPSLINGITLTTTQVGDLSVFLRTLTDTTFLKDTWYAKPQ